MKPIKMNLVKMLCCITLLIPILTNAQEKLTIDKVYAVNLRNTGEIMEGDIVKGYYMFYQSDKIDKHTNEYTLQVLDQNLGKLKDIKFQDSKNLSLIESSYNGQAMGFLFWDDDLKQLDFRVFDTQGKKKSNYTKPVDKKTEALIAQYMEMQGEDGENKNVYDIKDKGFVNVIPVREGKQYSYEVNFYSSESKKTWAYNPANEEKVSTAQYLGANDSLIVLEVLKKEKLMSGEMTSWILGINIQTGKKAFEISTTNGKNKFYPINIAVREGRSEFLLIGPYYQSDDRIMQDKSEGLAIWLIDTKGKIVSEKYNSWTGQISKFLKVDKKGRLEDIGYVYFHEVLQTEDGKIFAIGEGYKKQASAGGIALRTLATATGSRSNVSTVKLKITDMLVMQFDSKFDLENAAIYDKNSNDMNVPGGEFASPHTLALMVKAMGGFDYSFTQTTKNNAAFYTGYTDYEKGKDYKGLTFHSITYSEGSVSTDKINLQTKASKIRIYPAKPGFVLISEYFKKEKRLDLRMEKLN